MNDQTELNLFGVNHFSVTSEPPRESYTFFPSPKEAAHIADLDTGSLATLFWRKPEMAARFTHELWRTGRFDETQYLARQGAIPYPTSKGKMDETYLKDLVMSCGMMVDSGGVQPDECIRFVLDVTTLIEMGRWNKSSVDQLDEANKLTILTDAVTVLRQIEDVVKTASFARLKQEMEEATKTIDAPGS